MTWKTIKLSEVASVNESSLGKNFLLENIFYIDTSSVTENIFEKPQFLKLREAPSRAKRLVFPGDTIISTVRPIQKHYGFISEAKPNTIVSTGFAVVSPKKIDPKFLFYFLTQEQITTHLNTIAESGSTTFPAFRSEELNDLDILLPDSIDQQKAIAEILSSLDDKIELNNQINQNLESLAQALFKQWFVDFEFPNENGEPYKSSGGAMVDSELGEIPKGWKVSSIGDVTKVVTKGTTPTTIGGKFTDEGINFIKVESISESGSFLKSKFAFIDDDTHELQKRSQVQLGDVLFSIAGTIGRVAIATNSILPANTNQAIAIIRPDKVDSNFLRLLMKSSLIQSDTKSNVVQAVQANLSLGVIKDTKFILPNEKILNEFKEVSKSLMEMVEELTEEIESLTQLRDTLLPKLISGELEVNESLLEQTF